MKDFKVHFFNDLIGESNRCKLRQEQTIRLAREVVTKKVKKKVLVGNVEDLGGLHLMLGNVLGDL